MRKYWTVTYRAIGRDQGEEAWFSSREDAEEFYRSQECSDKPVFHRVTSEATASEYDKLVKATEWQLKGDRI